MDYRADTPDTQLTAKLTTEDNLAAVVAWLQAGLTRYLQLVTAGEPMPVPARVLEATTEFFDNADTIERWAEECLEDGAETQSSVLYAHHVAWCEGASGSLSQRRLSARGSLATTRDTASTGARSTRSTPRAPNGARVRRASGPGG